MKALDIASYFIELANSTPEHDLTNLKLQKLLYYTQGHYLAQTSNALFEDKVEAWKYGPVIPEVYHTFKACGSFPVTVFDVNYTAVEISEDVKNFIKDIWEKLGQKYSGSYLVTTTHAPNTPWAECFKEDERGIEIPQDLLKSYFLSNKL